jgi:DNA replication protein DnaC
MRDRMGRPASDAKREGRLEDELAALGRIPLLIVDEIRCIPLAPQATGLMFALVASRYERASMIVTSDKPLAGEIFGDDVTAAAAVVDRLVHHAEILNLKGRFVPTQGQGLVPPPPARSPELGCERRPVDGGNR